jgi:hypothetical protein
MDFISYFVFRMVFLMYLVCFSYCFVCSSYFVVSRILKREISRFLACWLDEIEEIRFDMDHVPGKLNPANFLSRRGLPVFNRSSRPTAFTDANALEKAFNVVGLETAPSAVLVGPPNIDLRAFAPCNSVCVQLLTGNLTVPSAQY